MKILIDINHPAHVHYFRNFIKIMESKGHEFKVINRDSKMINYLLDYYGIEHIIRNARPKKKGTIHSLFNLGQMTLKCIEESWNFHPDLFLGFASSACALASFVFRKPCILIDDTEHNTMNHKIYLPFCSCVLTPFYFKKDLGKKQIRFNAFVEQLYLHSSVYEPQKDVLNKLQTQSGEYVLVRYISYDAHHDLVAKPLSDASKQEIVDRLSKNFKVYVSHENENNSFRKYRLDIFPEQMHDVEANAKFMITEGATMASESFVLGVPSLYINPLHVGYTDIQAATFPDTAISSIDINEIYNAIEKLSNEEALTKASIIRKRLEISTINPTDFLVWFVENYPQSESIIKNNPKYMERFTLSQSSGNQNFVGGGNSLGDRLLVCRFLSSASCAA